jgi:tetratricopeptide (TPR) repeat protein
MQKFLLIALAGSALTLAAAVDPVQLKTGIDLFNQRKPAEALKVFEALARTDGDNPEVQFYLGRLALQKDDPERAIALLEKAVAAAPTEARYYLRLGDAYGRAAQKASVFSQLGLAKKCKGAYEKAVELDQKNVEARQSLLNFYLQAPGFAGGSTEKAQTIAEETKQYDEPRSRQMLAAVYTAQKKYDLAFAQFEEVLKQRPEDYTSLYQVGRLAANTGQFLDRGLAALRRCVQIPAPEGEPGHAPAWWRIGNILEKQNDKAGARAAYEAALKIDPKFSQAIEALKRL